MSGGKKVAWSTSISTMVGSVKGHQSKKWRQRESIEWKGKWRMEGGEEEEENGRYR